MKAQTHACWNCGAQLGNSVICADCHIASHLDGVDYFTLLSLPKTFDLDKDKLESQYLVFQQQLHPDKFVGRSEEDKAQSLGYSTALNEAYTLLKSPLRRAEYLLNEQGIVIHGDDATIQPSPELLMSSMELREEIEDASTTDDIVELLTKVKAEEAGLITRISKHFSQENWQEAATDTLHLQYITKAIQAIKQRLATL